MHATETGHGAAGLCVAELLFIWSPTQLRTCRQLWQESRESLSPAGGPAMIRAAAKNHEHVAVVVDPADYPALVEVLSGKQAPEEAARLRRRLAWKAFQHTATYDSTVAEWLWTQTGQTFCRRASMLRVCVS